MMIVTTEDIPGRRIVKVVGLVRGNTIRARHVGKDIKAAFRHMIGGEITDYTKLMGEVGANAVVAVRLTTSMLMGGAAEIVAYGTAVVVE